MNNIIGKYLCESKKPTKDEVNAAELVRHMSLLSKVLKDCLTYSGEKTHYHKEFTKMRKTLDKLSKEIDKSLADAGAPSYLRVGGSNAQKLKDQMQAVKDLQAASKAKRNGKLN